MTRDPVLDKAADSFDSVQDRHYRQCLKEAKLAAILFLITFVTCAAIVMRMGYPPSTERPAEPSLVWGVPLWVFCGVLVPWCVMILIIWWYALFYLKDDEPFIPFPEEKPNPNGPGDPE